MYRTAIFLICWGMSFLFGMPALAWEQSMTCVPGEDCDEGVDPLPTYWPNACVSFYLNESGTRQMEFADVEQAVKRSIAAWNLGRSSSLEVFYAGKTNEDRVGFNPYIKENANVIMFRDDDWEESRYVMAYTSVTNRLSTGEIYDADMELNAKYYTFGIVTSDRSDVVDLQNTVTHELGHAFGLDHSSVVDSTMYFMADRGDTYMRTLEADDIEGITTIYPPKGGNQCKFKAGYFEKPPYATNEGYPSGNKGSCSVGMYGEKNKSILGLVFLGMVLMIGVRRREERCG